MDRGAWQATVHGVMKGSYTTEQQQACNVGVSTLARPAMVLGTQSEGVFRDNNLWKALSWWPAAGREQRMAQWWGWAHLHDRQKHFLFARNAHSYHLKGNLHSSGADPCSLTLWHFSLHPDFPWTRENPTWQRPPIQRHLWWPHILEPTRGGPSTPSLLILTLPIWPSSSPPPLSDRFEFFILKSCKAVITLILILTGLWDISFLHFVFFTM